MLQKTEMSEVSTNVEARVTSFFTDKNREMYKQIKKNEGSPSKKSQIVINKDYLGNDILKLEPNLINTVAWPQIFIVDNELKTAIKDNFYEISGIRSHRKYIGRNSQPNAEILYFNVDKPGIKMHLISIERYLAQNKSNESELFLHMNIAKVNLDNETQEIYDFHMQCSHKQTAQVWDFCAFQSIQNCRKAVILLKVQSKLAQESKNKFKILLLDLQPINRAKPKTLQKPKSIENKIYVKIICQTDLDCDPNFGKQTQKFVKLIKSEFGDIILIATNQEIYELQIEQISEEYSMNLKIYKFQKIVSSNKPQKLTSEKKMIDKTSSSNNLEEEIVDIKFMINGLKIMILTRNGQIFVMQSHNYLFADSMSKVMTIAQLQRKYRIDQFKFLRIFGTNGSIAIQFETKNECNLLLNEQKSNQTEDTKDEITKGFMIIKNENNGFIFSKIINMQIQKQEVQYMTVHECNGADELLVQYINKKCPNQLLLYKYQILMSEINAMVKNDEFFYNYSKNIEFSFANQKKNSLNHFYPMVEKQKKYHAALMGVSSRIIYLLNDKQLTCYKIFSDLDSQKINKQIQQLFTHHFFEKPIKISINPLTLHFVIIFKQFVKFFYFNYTSIKNYFTLKIKNVCDVCYVGNGQKFLISINDGSIYLIDSYTFKEEKILQFYGEPIEVKMIDDHHLLIKSTKGILSFFKKGFEDSQIANEFVKVYEAKLEEQDRYYVNNRYLIIAKREGLFEVYSHQYQKISQNLPEPQRQSVQRLQSIHKHLINRKKCQSFQQLEIVTHVLLSQELGFLFMSTNKGRVKQYLWPLQNATNPNPPEVYSQKVSSQSILFFNLDCKFANIFSISESGSISQLKILQCIEGQIMPYIFTFNQKSLENEKQKRQFTDRSYFIDHYVPTETGITLSIQQSLDELQFIVDKIKDDIEEMTKHSINKRRQDQVAVKNYNMKEQQLFKQKLIQEQVVIKKTIDGIEQQIKLLNDKHTVEKNREVQIYQRVLLDLYKESDRLKNILKSQDIRLTNEKFQYIEEFKRAMMILTEQKTKQVRQLEQQYIKIEEKKKDSDKADQFDQVEEKAVYQLFKVVIHKQIQDQLNQDEQQKQKFLGQNTKKQKQINNLKQRSNYFENLILETKVQIFELTKDQEQYEQKKKYLREQLKDKEQIIQKIQKELVKYLKNTQDMKTIKNTHQFQLFEYQKEVNPIQENFDKIQSNVKHMNHEIMKQYNNKIEKNDLIDKCQGLISMLKEKKRKNTLKKLQIVAKFGRLAENLNFLVQNPFDFSLRANLKKLIGSEQTHIQYAKDQEKEKNKRQGDKLMRYKNMIRKQIEEEEKREEHILKNQHEFYKYHNQNTTLVRQFNELKKTQKILSDESNKLYEKLQILKSNQLGTPIKRPPSINIRKIHQKKLTPFQRYEQEQSTIPKKQQDTTETRLSKNSQSISFLKGLMKEVNHTESKYQKMEIMRERVRTFVNPQLKLKKSEEINKILFGRARGTSEMLKLK